MVEKEILAPFDNIRIPFSELHFLQPIAEGGFGIVYRGRHSKWGDIAYKKLKAAIIVQEDSITSELMREANLLCLNHPNIVILHAVTFEPEHYGCIFEFVKFGGLDGFIRKYQVDWPLKLWIAHHVVKGMVYLHGQQPPVIHADLKVQNVLIGGDFCAKVCDFGLSKWKQFSTERTGCKSVRGTVTHIPPEIWKSIHARRTVKYDVYSFSILLWELMTQLRPYGEAQEELIKLAVKDGQRPDMKEFSEPKFAVKCITRCWDDDPEKRPTFAELKVDLSNFLKDKQLSIVTARRRLQKISNTVDSLTNNSYMDHKTPEGASSVKDIHSLPLELHEMMLMSSLYRLTKTLLPIDARPDPQQMTKVETRAHVIAFKMLSSVCQHFHQVITKRDWFRQHIRTHLTAACRPFRLQPRLLQTLDTGQRTVVAGLTKLANRLYIVYNKSDTITMYNSEQQPFTKLRGIYVNGMKDPTDMATSVKSNCLYVVDWGSRCVWSIRADHRADKWIDGVNAARLSVTSEGHLVFLILTDIQDSEVNRTWFGRVEVYGVGKLKLTVLELPHDVGNPYHVIQTSAKTFIVCHVGVYRTLNRVVEVNNECSIVRSHGGPRGSGMGQLSTPWHIALDADERVFVADTGNRRILILSRKLNIERVLLTSSRPTRFHYDRESSQLAVGLNTGHVEIFNL